MTKVDKDNYKNGEKLPVEFNDAHAALRGFATSNLHSSVILSAGLNARLFSYMAWVKGKKCKTKLERTATTEELFLLIERAEKWLKENSYKTHILKWETELWGEIPADFGRKG